MERFARGVIDLFVVGIETAASEYWVVQIDLTIFRRLINSSIIPPSGITLIDQQPCTILPRTLPRFLLRSSILPFVLRIALDGRIRIDTEDPAVTLPEPTADPSAQSSRSRSDGGDEGGCVGYVGVVSCKYSSRHWR